MGGRSRSLGRLGTRCPFADGPLQCRRRTGRALRSDRPAPTSDAPQGVCLDEAYDHQFVRDLLVDHDLAAHIRS